MKIYFSLLVAGAAFAASLCADDYRIAGSDGDITDWNNSSNWSNSAGSTTPSTVAPSGAGSIYFYQNAAGTTTVLKRSEDPLNKGAFTFSNGKELGMLFGTFEIVNTKVTGLNRLLMGAASAGIVDTRNNSILELSNSEITMSQMSLSTNTYSDSALILKDNSSLTITGGAWNHITIANAANTTAKIVIEKGSSFITTTANINKQGAGVLTMDISGILTIGTGGNGEFEINQTSVANIYGSAQISIAQRTILKNDAKLVFHMQNIAEGRVASVNGGAIEGGATAIWTTGSREDNGGNSIRFENNSKIEIDLSDFSVNGNSFIDGETYAIMLISGSNFAVDLTKVGVINESLMGSEWSLAGSSSSDYLQQVQDGSKYNTYLLVTYTAIPEPSTYAAIFGALALGLAAYRRRK